MNRYNKINTYAKIFSPANFKKIILNEDYSTVIKKIERYYSALPKKDIIKTYGEIIDSLYINMFHSYRNEYIYKNIVINKLLLGKYSTNTTTVLNEFKIGKSKADLIFINGEIVLFEIKSEYDNSDRLESQIVDYQKACDQIYILVSYKDASCYLNKYITHSVGVIELTKRNTLRVRKIASKNYSYLDHYTLFKLLRKEEYLSLIKSYFGYIPKVPNTRIFRECLRLSKLIDVIEFQRLVFKKLKERKLLDEIDFNSPRTPYALKHICYFINPNKPEYENLYSFLNREV